ncbi:MAG: alpha/beta hydrolase [Desulfobacteraceae bacterium]|nr:alpha/beta hydrolase [Desulfobacteraceae bacterium]
MKSPLKRTLFAVIVLSLLGGCANALFFYPDSKRYSLPSDSKLEYEEVSFLSSDRTKLAGWFIPAVLKEDGGKAKGTIVHFHGNAQNMTAHFQFVKWLPSKGYNLFLFDYRGYGRSGGTPYRTGIYNDCLAALSWIAGKEGVDTERIFVLGQSLGGTLAIRLVAEHPEFGVRAVIADSPFASYRKIARDKIALISLFKWAKWPLSFLIATDSYSPVDVVGKLSPVPLLIIHGTDDRTVPFYHGQLLFEAANEPKEFWRIEKGRHTDVMLPHRMKYRKLIIEFLENATGSNMPEC